MFKEMAVCSFAWRSLLRGEHACAAGGGVTAWRASGARGRGVDEGDRACLDMIGGRVSMHNKQPWDVERGEATQTTKLSQCSEVGEDIRCASCERPWSCCTPVAGTCLRGYWRELVSTQGRYNRRRFRPYKPAMLAAMRRDLFAVDLSGMAQKLHARRHLCGAVRFYSAVIPGSGSQDCVPAPKLRPPWHVLFFGTDEFALKSLKILHKFRGTEEPVVGNLEVVTLPTSLPKGLPVRNYAVEHGIQVHEWPHTGQSDQFDVGVVASFGRLLSESLILQFPYGILNVHPSLLPRWRGPAPIIHIIMNGDETTGVTIMQIRPKRFDVGPIVMQETLHVLPQWNSKELEAVLAKHGAEMLISVLKHLPHCLACSRDQAKDGVTFAPKLTTAISCVRWEEQTPKQIIQLERAIGFLMPLQAVWMGSPIKLLNFTDAPDSLNISESASVPGSFIYHRGSNMLVVRCKDGWVGIRTIIIKKKLSATDFYNGYLHQWAVQKSSIHREKWHFCTLNLKPKTKVSKSKQASLRNAGQ